MTQAEEIDPSSPDAIGALDRFATNLGLAMLAVAPTRAIALAAPWRLSSRLSVRSGPGRRGLILSPGAFFLFAITLAMGVGASAGAPQDVGETPLVRFGVVIGPDEASRVVAALREGNAWGAVFAIVPVYFMVVFAGAMTGWMQVLLGRWWSVSTAVRAAFYFFGTVLFMAVCTSVALDRWAPSSPVRELAGDIASSFFLVLNVWMYAGFYSGRGTGRLKAAGFGVLASGSFFLAVALATALVKLL